MFPPKKSIAFSRYRHRFFFHLMAVQNGTVITVQHLLDEIEITADQCGGVFECLLTEQQRRAQFLGDIMLGVLYQNKLNPSGVYLEGGFLVFIPYLNASPE